MHSGGAQLAYADARSCGDPGDLLNGYKDGLLYDYPNIVKYRCVAGFELFGSAVRKSIRCDKPLDPINGQVVGTSLNFQSRVEYSCHDGYRLVGQVQRVCQTDRTWSGMQPVCEGSYITSVEKGTHYRCSEIVCSSVGPLSNGYIEGVDMRYKSTVMFRCLEGMTHIGPAYAMCQADAKWSHPMPKCLGSYEYNTYIKSVTDGRQIYYQCDKGWMLKVFCAHPARRLQNGRFDNGIVQGRVGKVLGFAVRTGHISWDVDSIDDQTTERRQVAVTRVRRQDTAVCPPLYDNRRQKIAVIKQAHEQQFSPGDQLMVLCRHGFMGETLAHGRDVQMFCLRGYAPAGNVLLRCELGEWRGEPAAECRPSRRSRCELLCAHLRLVFRIVFGERTSVWLLYG
ncbi:unnamed protein product [Sphagnum balticum]